MMKTVYHMRSCIENTVQLRNAVFLGALMRRKQVYDDFIINNPSDNVLRELKKAHFFQSEKRRALTRPEQDLFLDYLKTHPVYEHWYPVFAVMIGTGLRVGEVTGLRWCDIDMESEMIDVNHTDIHSQQECAKPE